MHDLWRQLNRPLDLRRTQEHNIHASLAYFWRHMQRNPAYPKCGQCTRTHKHQNQNQNQKQNELIIANE